jgi:hypothetical protein
MITRVVHLESRKDRLIDPETGKDNRLDKELFKLVDEYEFFPAIDPYPGISSSTASVHSHIEALKGVSGDLLVVEDDVCFLDEDITKRVFNAAMNELPSDWDLLYIGGNPKNNQTRYSEHLFWTEWGGIHCNHAILYQEKARDYILKNYDYRTNEIGTYDHWLFMVGQKIMKCFIISPMLAWQMPGFSNCRNGYMDYYLHMRSNEIRNMI